MKARVKATGEIVEVTKDYDLRESTVVEFYTNIEDPTDVFEKEDLEFPYDSEFIDYWTRLEHQYAGMAMQGLISCRETLLQLGNAKDMSTEEATASAAYNIATALVERIKNNNNQ